MKRETKDIVISGGGVAGLTAAAAFGSAGFSVVIVDPMPPITTQADEGADLRTTAFLQPARDFLIRAGLWSRLEPHATALSTMRIVDAASDTPVTKDFKASDISDLPFGWNLPNWLLRREMVARLAELPNVDFRAGAGFASMLARTNGVLVRFTDDTSVNAKLVIGADGRESAVRQAADIKVKTTRYGQKALTFAVTHDAPHNNISTEVHKSGGPFTLVPLPDHNGTPCSAVVWMETGGETARLQALPEDAFNAEATARSADVSGPLTLVSRRTSWPIIGQICERMSDARVALVAEAAHVLPPIGAQGLNMSLADLACLLDLAEINRDNLGSAQMLETYNRKRHNDVRLRVVGIDALNRASIAGSPLIHDLRQLGIQALHGIPPIRKTVMKLGLGAKS